MSNYQYSPQEIEDGLRQFTGGDTIYKHWLGITYTEGVKWLADKAGAFWLIDAIASWQVEARKDAMLRDFQMWVLMVNLDTHSAALSCCRDAGDVAFMQEIEWTDFPLKEIKFYLENNVLCLPQER